MSAKAAPPPPELNAEEVRERIVVSALRLFAEKGYAGTDKACLRDDDDGASGV